MCIATSPNVATSVHKNPEPQHEDGTMKYTNTETERQEIRNHIAFQDHLENEGARRKVQNVATSAFRT